MENDNAIITLGILVVVALQWTVVLKWWWWSSCRVMWCGGVMGWWQRWAITLPRGLVKDKKTGLVNEWVDIAFSRFLSNGSGVIDIHTSHSMQHLLPWHYSLECNFPTCSHFTFYDAILYKRKRQLRRLHHHSPHFTDQTEWKWEDSLEKMVF